MKKNYLIGVRSIYNEDKETAIEIETYFFKRIIKLPYKVIELMGDRKPRYEYSKSIKDYCLEHNIEYITYFAFNHKDCK